MVVKSTFISAFTLLCVLLLAMIFNFNFANGFNFGNEQSVDSHEASSQTTFYQDNVDGGNVLKSNETRDVSYLYSDIKNEEDQKAREAAEQKRIHDEQCIARANSNKRAAGNPNDGVDFSVGREKFIETWAPRINNYLAGYPLAGQGETFANAAFEYGVDPRVSPAISNTESTRGVNCFQPHNAWGWMGGSGWSTWEIAIYEHVKRFSEGYGYNITVGVAKKYCPPSYATWYSKTVSQIAYI